MHIKRFEAATMELALAQIRRELGPDALILSSKTIRRGRSSFGLMARSTVEVRAALERSDEVSNSPCRERVISSDRPPVSDSVLTSRSRFEAEVRDELRALRAAVARLAPLEGANRMMLEREGASNHEKLLLSNVDPISAELVISEWRERHALTPSISLRDVFLERMKKLCTPPRAAEHGRIRMVVGAPGVGKTTSLAKLAARNEEGERDVALVALDHYRIGAPEQLRRYAELLESPFEEISDSKGLAELASRYRDYEVLVDTAGRGQGDASQVASLQPFRDRLGQMLQVDLVIDATARQDIQKAQLRRFRTLRPDRLILTKTDECESLAPLTNLLLDPECPPMSWRGTGQRVPQDLKMVEPMDFVRDLFGAAA